ncbi:MAG TPA: chorismate synthase, partial [Desulfatirhabdiaceae bacterium]|nr:chorismate synthase [Desulfatirhabdiaceae bacterium]
MPGNTFGTLFRVSTWGESHGPGIGAVIDGCPPGLVLNDAMIQVFLDRRRPGRSSASTTRRESDAAQILSGVFEGKTTGCPICILIPNQDARSSAYSAFSGLFRPGHGDITYQAKYGIRDWRGGGRASARETAARVAAGAVAQAVLDGYGIRVLAYTLSLGGIQARNIDLKSVLTNPFNCPDEAAVKVMETRIAEVRKAGDSVGGIVEILATGVPAGLGEPVFSKLDADLAGALMGIGAVKGVEIGDGFLAAEKIGSEHNDPITPTGFSSNHAGGILAGISNGADIVIRVAVKPIPSISIPQQTVNTHGQPEVIQISGRHDISAIPRINPVCEAMVRLVLVD